MRGIPRFLAVGAVALGLGFIGVGPAHASGGCTDSWMNASGGTWDTPANWSAGIPTSTSSVCISAAGTYTVVVGNETISVANLTVGGTGSTATLQIGNSGAGEPAFTVTGAVSTASTGTISDGWGGSFSAGSLMNAGTFLMPTTGYASSFTFGPITNTGTFTSASTNTVSIGNGDLFDNASGTISVTGGNLLALSSPSGTPATLELDSGGLVNVDASSHLTVADTTAVHGGSICGTSYSSFTVGSGDGGTSGTLGFASTPGTGPSCGAGLTSDTIFIANTSSTLSGTIPAAYTVMAGDSGASFNTTALSGDVVNEGTFEPGFGATVTGSGTTNELTNEGTLLIPSSAYVSTFDATLANTGTVTIDSPLNVSLSTGQAWTNGTKGTNGTISVATGQTLALSSPSGQSATFTQDGAISNSGTFTVADPIQINGGSICGDRLNLGAGDGTTATSLSLTFAAKPTKGATCAKKVASHQLFIYNVTATINSNIPTGYTVGIGDGGSSFAHVSTPGALTNAGTLEPGFGATLTVNGTLTNSSTGKVTVPASAYVTVLDASGVTNSGAVTVDGSLNLGSPLTNNKTLTLGAGTQLNVTGSYTQGTKGSLVDPLSTKGHGVLDATGTATLAGSVKLTGKPALKAGMAVTFLEDSGTSGTFAKVTGPFTLVYGASGVTATAT
jgi:hypothetical protein